MSKLHFGAADERNPRSSKPKRTRRFGIILVLMAAAFAAFSQNQGDALLHGFQNPPDTAKPRVWWHWMSRNITKEGIKADLEWMKRRQRAVGLRKATREGALSLAGPGRGKLPRDAAGRLAMLLNGLDLAEARPRKNWLRRIPAA